MAASSVLNGTKTSSRVSEDTRARVLEAAKRLRYRPNATARGLTERRMNTIGLAATLGSDEPNQYFLEVFNGVIHGAAAVGQTVTVFPLDNWGQAPQRIPSFCDGRIDGLILLGPELQADAADWLPEHTPMVSVHANQEIADVVNLESDEEEGAFRMVSQMLEMGHRRILHMGGPIGALGADLLTLSAHKIGGPKGVGALIRARDDIHFADPLIRGGGQERGLRAGTENVAGIAAFGAAAATAVAEGAGEAAAMLALRNQLEAGLKAITPQAVIFGESAARLPNTTLFALPGMKAETAVIAFDLEGIAVSSGAACSSGKVQPSHVLAAMGVSPALTQAAVRVSLGWTTSERDIERFLDAWRKLGTALSKGQGIAA